MKIPSYKDIKSIVIYFTILINKLFRNYLLILSKLDTATNYPTVKRVDIESFGIK